jgi:signal transduction histidine kinase
MKFAPFVIVLYMLAALCWWTYLLYSKNEIIYNQQQSIYIITGIEESEALTTLEEEHYRQRNMIIAEGFVFGLALIVGITLMWIIYKRDLKNTERQNNFLLAVTHELKSPLASIKLALETIKKRDLSRNQNLIISDNGITEVDRLHKQLDNILDATSIDHKYNVEKHTTTLVESLNYIKHQRSATLDEGRVTYTVTTEDTQGRSIDIDINGVLKIAKNLIENALKYSESHVEVKLSLKDKIFRLTVSDEGPGIAPNEKQAIFKRFYRVGSEETRKSTGTGLGLFIVKQIVDKNQGKVTIQDNTPSGSVFQVEMNIS